MEPVELCKVGRADRSTKNAAALASAVTSVYHAGLQYHPQDYPDSLNEKLGLNTWEDAIDRIDDAAEALDWAVASYPHPPGFWWEYDWYLTVDKVAEELIAHPEAPWSMARVRTCLVPI